MNLHNGMSGENVWEKLTLGGVGWPGRAQGVKELRSHGGLGGVCNATGRKRKMENWGQIPVREDELSGFHIDGGQEGADF